MFFLSTIEAKAVKIIDNMSSFTFPEFQAKFNTKPITKTCVLDALKARYKKLFDENRFSTANSYLNAASSIEKFFKIHKKKKNSHSMTLLLNGFNHMKTG